MFSAKYRLKRAIEFNLNTKPTDHELSKLKKQVLIEGFTILLRTGLIRSLEHMLSVLQIKFSLDFESFLTLPNRKLKQRVKYIRLKSHEFASLMNYDRPEDMSLSFSPFRFTPVVC